MNVLTGRAYRLARKGQTNMDSITLVKSSAARKSQRLAIYNIDGRRGSVQFFSTLFGGDQHSQGNPHEKLTLTGTFAKPESDEERQARLAARPKPTDAEKILNLKGTLAKMEASLATGSTPAVASTPTPAAPPAKTVAAKGKKRR